MIARALLSIAAAGALHGAALGALWTMAPPPPTTTMAAVPAPLEEEIAIGEESPEPREAAPARPAAAARVPAALPEASPRRSFDERAWSDAPAAPLPPPPPTSLRHDAHEATGSGALVSAAHAAALAIAFERGGAATLRVYVDGAGRVERVEVDDAPADRARWGEAARAMAAALEGHTLRVRKGARGVIVRLRLEIEPHPPGAMPVVRERVVSDTVL